MKRFLTMTAIVFSAIVFSVVAPFSAHAGYILSLEQVGGNVVGTGSGSIDLADLAFYASGYDLALFDPDLTIIIVGSSTPNPGSRSTATSNLNCTPKQNGGAW